MAVAEGEVAGSETLYYQAIRSSRRNCMVAANRFDTTLVLSANDSRCQREKAVW